MNANGSGSVSTANNQSLTYASGDVANVSVGTAGDLLASFKPNAGTGAAD